MISSGSVLLRWVLVILMAFFLAIMLDNSDRNTRMLAAVFLIVAAQIREISLLSDAGIVDVKSKASDYDANAQKSPSPVSGNGVFGIDAPDSPIGYNMASEKNETQHN